MYSQTAKTLIDIAVGHLLKSVAWVSENGCKFHVETSASAAANGQSWRALCGATGDCYFIHSAKAVRPEMRCATCQELSTTGIQDVAPQGDISNDGGTNGRTQHCDTQEVFREGLTSNRHDGNEGILECADRAGEGRILRIGGETTRNSIDVADQGRGTAPLTESITVGDAGVSGVPDFRQRGQDASTASNGCVADSQISLIERLIPKTLPDADLCHCGQPAVHTCPCQAKVCVAHLYDGEGQHVEAQGFCADCVDLLQAERRGIERCGRAEAR